MNKKQTFIPKYWVFHNVLSDDIFVETLDKGKLECECKTKLLYPKEYADYENNEYSVYNVCLIEISLINLYV